MVIRYFRQSNHLRKKFSTFTKSIVLLLGTLTLGVSPAVNAQPMPLDDLQAIADVLSGEDEAAPVDARQASEIRRK